MDGANGADGEAFPDKFENLTRVGPGTPMGNLFRRFWLPALLASELTECDGTPVRIRILCEDLVAFRDTEGRIGIVSAYCPHKMAPLFFGRNEDCGLRCVYHGWKFDVEGKCVDIPNITPPDTYEELKEKASIKGYPAREAGGMIWVYMGPKEHTPELPGMEWLDVPSEQLHVARWLHRSNWLQAAEGEIDTSHISFLHSELDPPSDGASPTTPAPGKTPEMTGLKLARDGAPVITLHDTDYGFVYGSRRDLDDAYYWRISQWMLPMWSAIPPPIDDFVGNGRAWVPIDDSHTMAFCYRYRTDRPFKQSEVDMLDSGMLFPPRTERRPYVLPHGYKIDAYVPTASFENDYFIDREHQKTKNFTGIWGVNEQDRSLQEAMPNMPGHPPGIVDRSTEFLVKSDLPTMSARRILTRLCKQLEQGQEPTKALESTQYGVRAISMISDIEEFDDFLKEYGQMGFAEVPSGTDSET
ncbi:MAG: Rieske 2Fe-2S domain-containing protein [Marinosulfonomonas sp.]|nr:Rieske 2Fe-2S domain-containing protein [Marinosulfonomonas sp.]